MDFLNLCICIQAQKYTSSRLSKWMYISIFKLRSICEADFLYLCIYVYTKQYTRKRFAKLMYFFPILEVYLK